MSSEWSDDDGRGEETAAAGAELSPASAEIGELIGRLSEADDLDAETRTRLMARLARLLGASARRARVRGMATGRWLTDVFADVAPRIPIRDLETLSRHHDGLLGERLADDLVRSASNATTAVGAAGGALAAVEFAAPPLLLTAPAQVAAEAIVVATIEVKMIAELHEVYGVQIPGGRTTRGATFASAWAKQRGVNPLEPGSVTYALGTAARTALRRRLLRTVGRSMTTMGPFLTGAVAGATLNRTATRKLADAVRTDLRRMIGPSHAPKELPEAP